VADEDAVVVDPADVLAYGRTLRDLWQEAMPQRSLLLSDIPMLAMQAFLNSAHLDAGNFVGAGRLITQQQTAQAAFSAFLDDAIPGVLFLASAATVAAYSYRGTDEDSASTVNDVRYAFADPGAARPAGLPPRAGVSGETWRQHEQEGVPAAQALQAPDSAGQTQETIHDNTVVVSRTFDDGSTRFDLDTAQAGPPGALGPTVTSTTATLYHDRAGGVLVPPQVTVTTTATSGQLISVDTYQGTTSTAVELLPDGRHRTTLTSPDPSRLDDPSAAVVRTIETDDAPAPAGPDDGETGPIEAATKQWGQGLPPDALAGLTR